MPAKHTFAILFAFILCLYISPSVLAADEANVIIGYDNEVGKQQIIDSSNSVDYEFDHLQAVSVSIDSKKLEMLEANPNIKYIEENAKVQLADNGLITEIPELDGTSETERWNIHFTGVTKAWEEGFTGKNVNIAIIDTGISTHSELHVKGGVSTVDYTEDWLDDHGHGTHVAGTISAIKNNQGVVGIAPGANIFAVKALDYNGDGHLADVIDGIRWAVENNMDIINLSLGTQEVNKPFKEAIDYAYNQGALIVAASGNDGNGTPVTFPAKYENVIAVSAVNARMELAGFSSTGREVEFSAPGVGIVSTYLNGSYGFANGTSQASPHVTGMLAILKQKYPGMHNNALRKALLEHVNDLGEPGRDPLFGYGFIRYHALDTTPPEEVQNIEVMEQTSDSVTLQWDMPKDEDLHQVNIFLNDVYHGTVLQNEVSMYTLENLEADKKYYVTFYSEDISGNISSGKNYRIKTLNKNKVEVVEEKEDDAEGRQENHKKEESPENHVAPENKEMKNNHISKEQPERQNSESKQEVESDNVNDDVNTNDEIENEQDEKETDDEEEKDSQAKSSNEDETEVEKKKENNKDNRVEKQEKESKEREADSDSEEEEKGFFQKIVDFFIGLFEAFIDLFR